MSTDRKRLSSAIQRIAEQSPDIRQAIEATRPRGDQASAAGVGTSDAERDRVCCDGSTSDSTNPGTDTRDTSEGGQDAGDGLNADDPADIGDMGSGSLTGLHDCATGEAVCFEGLDWIPPDDWDSPSDPPVLQGYDEGLYFDDDGIQSSAVDQHCLAIKEAREIERPFQEAVFSEQTGLWSCRYYYGGGSILTVSLGEKQSCDDVYNPVCDDLPPTADSWPSDGCTNLAIRGGSIVGSKYDPENDGSYSKPMSEIKLCDDFGNSFYLRPSAGGGWKSISDLTTGPDGHLYDSTGMQIRRISHDEFTDSTV